MSCNNCGNKASLRHAPRVVVGGDVDKTRDAPQPTMTTERTFVPDPKGMPPDPRQAFNEAKSLTFDDIMSRNNEQLNMAGVELERMYGQMTDAMRQFHVVSLVAVANYENMAMPGVTPDQAIVALKTALDREDFIKINELYPDLKGQINARWSELMAKRITL